MNRTEIGALAVLLGTASAGTALLAWHAVPAAIEAWVVAVTILSLFGVYGVLVCVQGRHESR